MKGVLHKTAIWVTKYQSGERSRKSNMGFAKVIFIFAKVHDHETLPEGESVCVRAEDFFHSMPYLGSSFQRFMLCARCQRPLYSKLSSLCNPCAAARTLEVELAEPWENEKLRVIAGDIAVSAVRQVRALRLYRAPLAPEATSKAAPARPPLERRPGAARERSRSRGREVVKKEVEEQRKQKVEREGTSEKGPQHSRGETRPEKLPQEENRRVPYSPSPESYYSTSSAGENKKVTLAEAEVAEKKHKEESVSNRGTEERSEKSKRRESGAGPIPAVTEAGSAEDKKRSKEEYLAYVNADKGSVKLEENPESRSAERPRGNLLKVFQDEPEKRGDGKRKRKKHQ